MQITFLETRRLSETGHDVKRFQAGETYEVADTAARAAIRNGWAIPLTEGQVMAQLTDRIFKAFEPKEGI